MKARQAGPFRSLFDFTERVEEGSINKRVLEGLVCSGAFDSLNPMDGASNHWRARLFATIDSALARSARAKRAKAMGQNDLFGGDTMPAPDAAQRFADAQAWTASEMLAAEKRLWALCYRASPGGALRTRRETWRGDIG